MFHRRFSFFLGPLTILVPLLALPLAVPPARGAAPAAAPTKTTLPSGVRIVCRPEPSTASHLVAIDVFVRVGAAQETDEKAGLADFAARTVLLSTTSAPPVSMAHDIGALGGNVSVSREPDWTRISALTVSDRFDDAVYLLADVLKNADFDADAVQDTRQNILDEIDSHDASLFQTTYDGLRRVLYAGSGYARPPLGTAHSVARITRGDLIRFYNRYYVPQNFLFVVVGDIDPHHAIDRITRSLQDFPDRGSAGHLSDPTSLPAPAAEFMPVHSYGADLTESCVMTGFRLPPPSSEDYPALQVANALVGGMKTSRLFTNLREKQGLAYDLGSVLTPHMAASDLAGYVVATPTEPDTGALAGKKKGALIGLLKEQVLHQFQSLQTAPPTPAELTRAQHYLIGSYLIKHERIEDRATLLGTAEMTAKDGYQFDTDYARYINAVTAADVQRVAIKYFAHPAVSTTEPDTDKGGVVNE